MMIHVHIRHIKTDLYVKNGNFVLVTMNINKNRLLLLQN